MTSVVQSGYDHQITGLAGVAVRVGTALEGWGRRHRRPVLERDDLILRHRAWTEAQHAIEARRTAQNLQQYVLIR